MFPRIHRQSGLAGNAACWFSLFSSIARLEAMHYSIDGHGNGKSFLTKGRCIATIGYSLYTPSLIRNRLTALIPQISLFATQRNRLPLGMEHRFGDHSRRCTTRWRLDRYGQSCAEQHACCERCGEEACVRGNGATELPSQCGGAQASG